MSKIKDIIPSERPREKIISSGVENLNNYELLQVVLATGSRGFSVDELVSEILKSAGSLYNLSSITLFEIMSIKGIKKAKACLLLASIELGRRVFAGDIHSKVLINNPKAIYQYCLGQYQNILYEKMIIFYVDNFGHLLKEQTINGDGLSNVFFNPKEICFNAIKCGCYGVILTHNHISGNAGPSKSDESTTSSMVESLKIANVKLVEHLIIGYKEYYSFLLGKKVKVT
jgi:DNA repair protein RadC